MSDLINKIKYELLSRLWQNAGRGSFIKEGFIPPHNRESAAGGAGGVRSHGIHRQEAES